MTAAPRRPARSDRVGPRWNPCCRAVQARGGRPATDHRQFRHAGLGILRPEAPWRDLSPASGDGQHTHRRCRQWRDRGVGAALCMGAAVRDAPACAAWRIDARPIKVPPHAAGTQGGNPQRARTQGSCMPSGIGPRTHRGGPSGWD